MADFTLPELGENVTTGDVLRVLVKPGDTVAKDQTVLELETDKATIEVPSSVAGRVTAVSVKPGDKVKDRKSTRLNSSHGYISYAVFCLKKKKKKRQKDTKTRTELKTMN